MPIKRTLHLERILSFFFTEQAFYRALVRGSGDRVRGWGWREKRGVLDFMSLSAKHVLI